MNIFKRMAFKRAVREWRTKGRLYRELVKTIHTLQVETLKLKKGDPVGMLNCMMLDLLMPDYRVLDDELRSAKLSRRMRKLRV